MNDSNKTPTRTDHASPYPVSRLSPAFDLVNLAQEIAQADEILADRAGAQLRLIAEQMKLLQQQAQEILQQTQRDQQLHRARCNFRKQSGQIYHLYQDRHGKMLLSLLSPEDWRGHPPHNFMGSYRLENDKSWTPLAQNHD